MDSQNVKYSLHKKFDIKEESRGIKMIAKQIPTKKVVGKRIDVASTYGLTLLPKR
jgi:hypothetical protein